MRDFPGKSPSLLSDEHLRAIGAIVVNWNAIDIVLELIALGFYTIPINRGLVFTNNLSFQNKLTILRIAGTHGAIKNEEEKRDFLKYLDKIEQANNKRNAVVHGRWAGGKVQGLAKRIALRVRGRKLTPTIEQVPLADLEATAVEFLELHAGLRRWIDLFGVPGEFPPPETGEDTPK